MWLLGILLSKTKIAHYFFKTYIWEKVFKNGPSEIYERQPLKNGPNFTWSILEHFGPYKLRNNVVPGRKYFDNGDILKDKFVRDLKCGENNGACAVLFQTRHLFSQY